MTQRLTVCSRSVGLCPPTRTNCSSSLPICRTCRRQPRKIRNDPHLGAPAAAVNVVEEPESDSPLRLCSSRWRRPWQSVSSYKVDVPAGSGLVILVLVGISLIVVVT